MIPSTKLPLDLATLPDFMAALGVREVPDIDGHGDVWIISVVGDGEVVLDASHFGD